MDVTRVRDIIDLCGDRMCVFGGIMGFESFVEGAEGWVSVGSNILPAASSRLFTLTADDKNYTAASTLYHQMLPLIRLVSGHRYVSATKAALNIMGFAMGSPRSPRLPLPTNELADVHDVLRQVNLINGSGADNFGD